MANNQNPTEAIVSIIEEVNEFVNEQLSKKGFEGYKFYSLEIVDKDKAVDKSTILELEKAAERENATTEDSRCWRCYKGKCVWVC